MSRIALDQRRKDKVVAWLPEIKKAAKKANLDWPDVTEADDLAQDVCLYLLERPNTISEISKMDDNHRYQTLHKTVQRIASTTRDARDIFSGNFRYSVGEVGETMKDVGDYWRGGKDSHSPFNVSEFSSGWNCGEIIATGGGTHSDPVAHAAIGGLSQKSTRADLIAALTKMNAVNKGYIDMLVRRYVNDETGMDTAERSRLSRALVELTNEMNHARKRQFDGKLEPGKTLGDGPGSRKAISNSTARWISRMQYEGDPELVAGL